MTLPYSIVGLRLSEIVLLGLLVLAVGLLFLRRRPAGLVWVSVLLMGAMLAHLMYDQARWQMVPGYAVLFVFSIWLAVPSRRKYRVAGVLVRVLATILLVVPAIGLPLLMPVFGLPAPSGPFAIGVVNLVVSTTDTSTTSGDAARPMSVTVHYPADPSNEPAAPYWRSAEVRDYRLPGLPWIASTHLLVVPTNGRLRAPIVSQQVSEGGWADGRPLVLFAPGDEDLPSDHLMVLEELASWGWLVVSLPVGATAEDARRVAERFRTDSLDQAFAGQVDTVRSVILRTETSTIRDVGLPAITLHSEGPLVSARLSDRTLQLSVAGATIPSAARTARYLMVRPSRLLVGSSDVAAGVLNQAIRAFVTSLTGDGSPSSPIFSGKQPDTSVVAELLPSAAILPVE